MTRPRRVAALVAVAAALYGVAMVVTPHAPPIYDGIGFPDEPYRFVDPPAGYRDTQPPTTAKATIGVNDGRSTGGHTISSAESGPQVSLYVPSGGVLTGAAASNVTVRAAPVALTGSPPPGHLWGNVYRVSFTTASGPARQAPDNPGSIFLRAPTFQAPPTFYVRHGSTWSPLRTRQTGRDIYQAQLAGVGDYVLTGEDPLDFGAKDPSNEAAVGAFGFVVTGVGLVVILFLFIRAERRRSRRRAH